MGVKLTKKAIDLGIIVKDGPAALGFYRDVLGFKHEGDMPMPNGGGTMHRLLCGDSLIKVVVPAKAPPAVSPPGGIGGSTGYRYWTISVSNISELVGACEKAGRTIVVPEREIRPGIRIAIVEDPDGNWVEFLQQA
ncbi:MAG TPA: VOC family protein [Pseudomonadales bacterium]|nr:VOC family protein [Pseudomonadales bacterium]